MYFAMTSLIVVVDGKVVLEEFGSRGQRFGSNFEIDFEGRDEV
jgi:hypothetical protein